MDTKKSDEAQNDSFETIAPEKDKTVNREFEIGQLGNDELKEDELKRNEAEKMDSTQTFKAVLTFILL